MLIELDLYKLPEPYDSNYPEGYKFSWIALDLSDPKKRVLFDCHTPKGPHFHIDEEKEGASFEWVSLSNAQQFFYLKVIEHFGEIPDLRGALE